MRGTEVAEAAKSKSHTLKTAGIAAPGIPHPKWQLPDAFVFIDAIPRTSVGKFKKLALREQFATWKWE